MGMWGSLPHQSVPANLKLTNHHSKRFAKAISQSVNGFIIELVAGVAGFEPATIGLEGRCSIQLSYTPNAVRLNSERWGDRRVLNPLPPESQSGALPVELRPPR